jgi:hypothetical protein
MLVQQYYQSLTEDVEEDTEAFPRHLTGKKNRESFRAHLSQSQKMGIPPCPKTPCSQRIKMLTNSAPPTRRRRLKRRGIRVPNTTHKD